LNVTGSLRRETTSDPPRLGAAVDDAVSWGLRPHDTQTTAATAPKQRTIRELTGQSFGRCDPLQNVGFSRDGGVIVPEGTRHRNHSGLRCPFLTAHI
jgi:hypothetical protein